MDIKIISFLLIFSNFSSGQENSLETFSWENTFENLLQQHPTVVLLDEHEGDVELEVRDSLISIDHPGKVLWRRSSESPPTIPTTGSLRNIEFRWSFVCLLEEKRSKTQASRYLRELLEIGHVREDRFIFVGSESHISTILKSPIIQKFKNVLGFATGKTHAIYQRNLGEYIPLMKSKFKPANSMNFPTSNDWLSHKELLSGNHFRISGSRFPPYMDAVYHKGRRIITGVNYLIFKESAVTYNYTFDVNPESKWKSTGLRLRNGTWTGVFGDLLYDRADVAAVSSQSPDRNGLADFIGPFGRANLVFVTAPGGTSLGKYEIFSAYSITEWAFTAALFVLFLILCHHGLRYHFMDSGQRSPAPYDLFGRAFVLSWALTLEQNLPNRREQQQGVRALMVIWACFIIIIGNGYKSNLSANTSIPEQEFKPNTFKALDKYVEYKVYSALWGTSAHAQFRDSNTEAAQNLFRRIQWVDNRNTTECVVRAFMEPKSVCIGWDFTLQLAATRNLSISQLDNPLQQSDFAWSAWETFALQKHSVFTHAFQKIGLSCYESGLKTIWQGWLVDIYRDNSLKWTAIRNDTRLTKKLRRLRRKRKRETMPLTINNLEQVFLILATGLFVSCLSFGFELLLVRKAGNRRIFIIARKGKRPQIQIIKVQTIDFVP